MRLLRPQLSPQPAAVITSPPEGALEALDVLHEEPPGAHPEGPLGGGEVQAALLEGALQGRLALQGRAKARLLRLRALLAPTGGQYLRVRF